MDIHAIRESVTGFKNVNIVIGRLANAEKLQRHIRRHGKQAQGLDMYFSRGVHLIVKGKI